MNRPKSNRDLLNAEPLTVTDIAKILRATASNEGEFNQHVVRLAQECERLQWELQGAIGARDYARSERNDLESRYYQLQMTRVPGGQI